MSLRAVLLLAACSCICTAADAQVNTTTLFTRTAGKMHAMRDGHTATLLQNGQVLFTGGARNDFRTETAELYNPATDTFTALFPHTMREMRAHQTATLLQNGQVLIAGGSTGDQMWSESDRAADTAEIFDLQKLSSATPTQAVTSLQLLSPGGIRLEGKTTARRYVVIEGSQNLSTFSWMGGTTADEHGHFTFQQQGTSQPTHLFFRVRLP
jgi:hypothetical protein